LRRPREGWGQSERYRVTIKPKTCEGFPPSSPPSFWWAYFSGSLEWNAGWATEKTKGQPGLRDLRTAERSGPRVGRSIMAMEQTAASRFWSPMTARTSDSMQASAE